MSTGGGSDPPREGKMEDETGVTVVYRGEERIRDMSQGQKRPVSSKNRATEFVKLLKKKKIQTFISK